MTITCGFDEALTQQHGLFHGGVVASLVDVACGYAALSVMPADREVLTVDHAARVRRCGHEAECLVNVTSRSYWAGTLLNV